MVLIDMALTLMANLGLLVNKYVRSPIVKPMGVPLFIFLIEILQLVSNQCQCSCSYKYWPVSRADREHGVSVIGLDHWSFIKAMASSYFFCFKSFASWLSFVSLIFISLFLAFYLLLLLLFLCPVKTVREWSRISIETPAKKGTKLQMPSNKIAHN
jgi:hypothetical protein